MEQALPVEHNKSRAPLALLGALVMSLLVFLAIPVTQHLGNPRSDVIEFRETLTITPPAPTLLPPPPEQVQPREPEPKPEFKEQLQDFSLNQLELSLQPSIGGALKMGIASAGFATEVDALSEIQKLFTFADLQSSPRVINSPSIVYPRELIRSGIREGQVLVEIEIDIKGRARVLKIISASDPRFIPAAKEVIRKARFTPPKVGGVPQKVYGEWPIILRAP
jgi:protein TonB